jgi:hypothetical protein
VPGRRPGPPPPADSALDHGAPDDGVADGTVPAEAGGAEVAGGEAIGVAGVVGPTIGVAGVVGHTLADAPAKGTTSKMIVVPSSYVGLGAARPARAIAGACEVTSGPAILSTGPPEAARPAAGEMGTRLATTAIDAARSAAGPWALDRRIPPCRPRTEMPY